MDLEKTNLKNLRIADVELFISAAHLKNLGKSATVHHLSQSAASTAVQRLEAACGVMLCTHEKRQFRLTREGQLLLPRLEHWLNELRDIVASKERAPIRLVTTHAMAQLAVPALLPIDNVEFKLMRPDQAYGAVLRGEADIALVLDNGDWKGVVAAEIGKGYFQLYSRQKEAVMGPILLPEEQMEVLSLQQSWEEMYGYPLAVKSRIPSWSLIANICGASDEVGFLPDFLAKRCALVPVRWQPAPSPYRVLVLYRMADIPKEIQNLGIGQGGSTIFLSCTRDSVRGHGPSAGRKKRGEADAVQTQVLSFLGYKQMHERFDALMRALSRVFN